jgi:dienelactone hydrolase
MILAALRRCIITALVLASLVPIRALAGTIPIGKSALDATIAGTTLHIYTYRPANCAPRTLLLVFHGVGRNASGYRNHAIPLAEASCGIVVAPLFDKSRFPMPFYQLGGVADRGAPVSPGHRTVDLVSPLVDWAREATGLADHGANLTLVLVGHSAGAQFLGRVAAFAPPPGAARYIVANPSTWVMPSLETPIPYGFGGLPGPAAEQALRAYLALPITVLLGESDVLEAELATGPEAMAQGPTRLARGRNAFLAARDVATKHGWPFGWTTAEVPDVGHSATPMFASPQAIAALPR